ncbi:MAG: LuxR C-terminal-related transcriptional regulator [Pseudomonadota bacterium]
MGAASLVFELADRFYEAAEDPTALPEALTLLAERAGAHHAIAAERRDFDGAWGAAVGNIDPELQQRMLGTLGSEAVKIWLGRFPSENWDRMCRMVPTDTPLSRALYESQFYSDFVEPLGGHHAALTSLDLGEGRSFLSVFRPEKLGDYETDAMRLLEAVRPHVARAFRLRRQFQAAEAGARAGFAMLERLSTGVVLLDRRLRLLFANTAATNLSAASDAFALDDAGLRIRSAPHARQLQALLVAAATDRGPTDRPMRLALPREGSPFPILLQVERLETPGLRGAGANVGVFVSDPGVTLAVEAGVLVEAFGLTPREAALAAALARGTAPKQAAFALGMSESTAKTHVKRILDKAGAHRTAELVSLVGRLSL